MGSQGSTCLFSFNPWKQTTPLTVSCVKWRHPIQSTCITHWVPGPAQGKNQPGCPPVLQYHGMDAWPSCPSSSPRRRPAGPGGGRPPSRPAPGAPRPAPRARPRLCPPAPGPRLAGVPSPRARCPQRGRSPFPQPHTQQRHHLAGFPSAATTQARLPPSPFQLLVPGPNPLSSGWHSSTPCLISLRPSLSPIPLPSQTRLNPSPFQPSTPAQLDQPPWPVCSPYPPLKGPLLVHPHHYSLPSVSLPHIQPISFPAYFPTTPSQHPPRSSLPTLFPLGSQFPTTPLLPCLLDCAQPQLSSHSLSSWLPPRAVSDGSSLQFLCLLSQASGLTEESQVQFQKQHLTPDSQGRVPSTEVPYKGVGTTARASWNISTPC
ncbi:unnamed protein product [Nyctereutes procyonoides]|uniref:(raccoon dog) hypothetical protein n=1 Tax=Nyctereutes procyonoides TaxID=34880 RepID=A0A811YJT7_NYCPR|nr:unnamed protein product [Nyctereutes procyonoides]